MFELTHEPIDINTLREAVESKRHGATLLFLGVARDHFDGRPVTRLEYEAYREMAIPALRAIGEAVAARWAGTHTAIVHRLGLVPTTEVAVGIATSTPHRADCYAANRFAIEELKRTVPIWKKEIYADGSAWKANNAGE